MRAASRGHLKSAGQPVAAAFAPVDERLRQFRRLTAATGETSSSLLTFKQLGDCLGWFATDACKPVDALLVRNLTEALLRRRDGDPVNDPAHWYDRRDGATPLWCWPRCLLEMRVAVVYVSRLRMGDAYLSFLARDVAMHAKFT